MGILTGTDKPPSTAIVDKGYRGVKVEGDRILMSGQKRGVTRTLKAMIKRRSAIEPAIGHMKMDGRLARNPLKGALGDALRAGHTTDGLMQALAAVSALLEQHFPSPSASPQPTRPNELPGAPFVARH